MRILVLPVLLLLTLGSCDSGKSLAQQKKENELIRPQFTAGPPTLVYKTKKDYSNNVPVLLSEDRSRIVSYPAPQDFRNAEQSPRPQALAKGYWLDERGIGLPVAYLKLTYEEYAALDKAPSLAELMNMIIDKDPLTEMCNCGNRLTFTDAAGQLNAIINAGKLRSVCKVIK